MPSTFFTCSGLSADVRQQPIEVEHALVVRKRLHLGHERLHLLRLESVLKLYSVI